MANLIIAVFILVTIASSTAISDLKSNQDLTDICDVQNISVTSNDEYHFISANYPNDYNIHTECTLYVTASNGGNPLITFVDFELENTWDFLSVGFGGDSSNQSTTFAYITGVYAPHTVTSDKHLTVWMFFDADGKYTKKGFHLTITRRNDSNFRCGDGEFSCANNGGLFCLHDFNVCDGAVTCPGGEDEAEDLQCDYCGESTIDLAIHPSLNLTSHRYPVDFPRTQECHYFIKAQEGYRVLATVLDFRLHSFGDEFYAGDGDDPTNTSSIFLVQIYRGGDVPVLFTSSQSKMWMTFKTLGLDGDWPTGWESLFAIKLEQYRSADNCSGDTWMCKWGLECVHVSLVCDGIPQCIDHSDEIGCGTCEENSYTCGNGKCVEELSICNGTNECLDFYDELGCFTCGDAFHFLNISTPSKLISPYYPGNPRMVSCIWLIMAQSEHRILINVTDFEMYRDDFAIGNGVDPSNDSSVIVRKSGATIKPYYVSQIDSVWITWQTIEYDTGYRGFIVEFTSYLPLYTCSNHSFLCDSLLECIDKSLVCDGKFHCLDGSDELHCGCGSMEFQCPNGPCVDTDEVCDANPQCDLYEDELECMHGCSSPNVFLTNHLQSVVLSSPNYPDTYPCGVACYWVITTDANFRVAMEIRYFYVTPILDAFTFGHWHDPSDVSSIIKVMTYRQTEGTIYLAEGHQMWISFISGCSHPWWAGWWDIELSQSNGTQICTGDKILCSSGDICFSDQTLCDGIADCADYSDEANCELCGNQEVTLTPSAIYNLSYPIIWDTYGKDCSWLITSTSGLRIRVSMISFNIHDFWASTAYMGNGHDVTNVSSTFFARYGGVVPAVLWSNRNLMWIKVDSNTYHGDDFFYLTMEEFTNKECNDGEIICECGFVCINQTKICDGEIDCPIGTDELGCDDCREEHLRCGAGGECVSKSSICDGTPDCTQYLDETDCVPCGRSHISLDSMTDTFILSSPNYPSNYLNLMECTWFLKAEPQHVIRARFLSFVVHLGVDFYTIGLGPGPWNSTWVFDAWTGGNAPSQIISSSNEIWIHFSSDYEYTFSGYLVEFTQENVTGNCDIMEFTCSSVPVGTMCLHALQKCDGIPICPDEEDEQQCGDCGARHIYLEGGIAYNLTSSNYPDNYKNDLLCGWLVTAVDGRHILLSVISFDLERGFDYLTLGNGHESSNDSSVVGRFTGEIKLHTIVTQGQEIWMSFATDRSGTRQGFFLQLVPLNQFDEEGFCADDFFDCREGYCATKSAKCDGFNDCLKFQDEINCANITCPGSYLCDGRDDVTNTQQCVPMEVVCDGEYDCPQQDDETDCDTKRCPSECSCYYQGNQLYVHCTDYWYADTLESLARTTTALELRGHNKPVLNPGMFKGLEDLKIMTLARNNISSIQPRAFDGLGELTWLDISTNEIATIKSKTLEELKSLTGLQMWDLPLTSIEKGAYDGLRNLTTLVLINRAEIRGQLEVKTGAFRDLRSLQTLYVDDHRLCCHFDNLKECITLEPQPPLFMCGSLMQNAVLRVSMWVLGISALVGNFIVIGLRFTEKSTKSTVLVHSFLVFNLAVSDFQMGVYMLILAATDVYYGDEYFLYSDAWRASNVCKLAGFISILSSEASVFFITLISVDRFIAIVFPFSQRRLRIRSARIAVSILWCIALTVGIFPVLYADPESDIYDLSDVCIGLPLITRPTDYTTLQGNIGNPLSGRTFAKPVAQSTKPAWYFSIALFLGVNCACFLVVLVCYVAIFVNVRISMKQAKRNASRDEEIKMAIKMAVIVGTDFLCWVPIILTGILSQTEAVVVPLQMYTWTVVFILPINSSLNPYLYTLSNILSKRRSGKEEATKNSRSSSSISK